MPAPGVRGGLGYDGGQLLVPVSRQSVQPGGQQAHRAVRARHGRAAAQGGGRSAAAHMDPFQARPAGQGAGVSVKAKARPRVVEAPADEKAAQAQPGKLIAVSSEPGAREAKADGGGAPASSAPAGVLGRVRGFVRDRGLTGGGTPAMIPDRASFARVFGTVLVFLFAIEAVTGIALAAFYAPSSTDAWASVAYVQDQVTLGWFVRGLHFHTASAIVLVAGAHLLQTAVVG